MKMNTLRSLTLGKVTGTSAGHACLDEEVLRAGSKGFIGCLSSVQFNHLTPLKTAILSRGSSLVHVLGNLVESNCGALADSTTSQSASEGVDRGVDRLKKTRSDSAVIGGLITAVFLITLCAVAVTSCFLYRRCSHSHSHTHTHPLEKASISQKKDSRHSPEHSYPAGLENSYPVDLVLDLNLDLHSSVSHSRKEYYI